MLATTTALVLVAALAAVPAPAPPAGPAWGEAVKGLRLGLRTSAVKGGEERLLAILENTGDKDLVVQVGILLANGKTQLPTAFRLTLTDGDGKTYRLERMVGGVAGRVDPFVVPLPAGAQYAVPCGLRQFGTMDAGELAPGRYRVVAEYVGQAVTEDVNGESAPRLMAYWTGTLRSGEVSLTLPASVK